MTAEHTVWFRDPHLLVQNILSNSDFKDTFDPSPYQEYDAKNNHQYHNFMSGNWAWRHAVSTVIMRVSILISFCRTSSLKMLQHMGPCLCPSSWAAIRRQFCRHGTHGVLASLSLDRKHSQRHSMSTQEWPSSIRLSSYTKE